MPITRTHEVQPGDVLAKIAAKYKLSLDELLDANQQITNPNLIRVGQHIVIPRSLHASLLPLAATQFDGLTPAPSTIQTNAAALVLPPLTNDPSTRSAANYD